MLAQVQDWVLNASDMERDRASPEEQIRILGACTGPRYRWDSPSDGRGIAGHTFYSVHGTSKN
jgi:hypothetical protein